MASHIGAPSNRRNYHKKKGAYTTATTFPDDFVNILSQYTDEVCQAIMEEVQTVANEGCEQLKSITQPPASESGTANPIGRRAWKKYANSWDVENVEGANFVRCTIHNKKHYRLTHLLEYGHATRDGKRTRAFKHIEPINKELEDKLTKTIPKIIEKGGKL